MRKQQELNMYSHANVSAVEFSSGLDKILHLHSEVILKGCDSHSCLLVDKFTAFFLKKIFAMGRLEFIGMFCIYFMHYGNLG